MAKNLKLYVPVITPKRSVVVVGVHNTREIIQEIPATKDIAEHLYAQQLLIEKGGTFSSIKISVTKERFTVLQKELSQKTGGSYRSTLIDIVLGLDQLPIIQIVGNKSSDE